jgi:N-acetylglutamate synthase-like GNAT family acetyltransferase
MPLKHPDLQALPPAPETPAGFSLRTWRDGDELTVPPVLGDGFNDPEMSIYEAQLKNWHAKPGVDPEGCFVLETTQGLPIATAIGRMDPTEPHVGRLHQVAVRRAYWRRGLGTVTVLSAMQYMAQSNRKEVLVGWEWESLLFYLSLGFIPVTENEELLTENAQAIVCETAQAWSDVYQLFDQVYPAQRHLLKQPNFHITTPVTTAASDIWIDDFMVDDDGDLKVSRATIGGHCVHFGGQDMSPEKFLGALQAEPADPDKPVFLRTTRESPGAFARHVRSLLWSAGYSRSGIVGPRS